MAKIAFHQFALATAIAGAMSFATNPTFVAGEGKEKCFGIAKAGESGSSMGEHAAGQRFKPASTTSISDWLAGALRHSVVHFDLGGALLEKMALVAS